MTKVIGITGSIAVGKSAVTTYLLQHGYEVVDADVLSHQALQKGNKSYDQIVEHFDCLDEQGEIDRKKLGAIVFHNQKEKQILEGIIHPYVIQCMQERIQSCHDTFIFLDIPLLYESHMEYLCDAIMVVYVDEDTQCARLMRRNQLDEKQAKHLMSLQMSIEEKKKQTKYIIDNRLGFQDLYKEIERVLGEMKDEVI